MSPRQQIGVVVGLVVDVDDPEGLGRIKVSFPWLSDDNQSQWARMARLMAGNDYGTWFMPEVDDEVLLAFEHGDFQHPYVIGFLWNGRDLPPNSDIDVKVRRIKTVSGHILEFDDRSGQELVRIKTQGNNLIELDDVGAKLTIQTNGGQEIVINDRPPSISIGTRVGNKITISDAPPGIEITTQAGILNINCLTANVTASTMLTVNAPLAVFSGIVQTPTLIAQSVVSTSYTPGLGNIW